VSTIADLLPGKPVFLWVSMPSNRQLPQSFYGREVRLVRDATIVSAWVHEPDGNGFSWPLLPKTDLDDDRLRSLVGDSAGAVAVLHARDSSGRWVQLRVHAFDAVRQWPPLNVAVDDRVFDSVRRMDRSRDLRKPKDVLAWLRNRLRLLPPPGQTEPHRLIAVSAPRQELHEPAPCLLLGDGIAAGIAHTDDGWRISMVRKHTKLATGDQRLVLVHGDIDFIDTTIGTRLREQMRDELGRINAAQADESFLARWREYHELESRHALNRMKTFGYLVYHRWNRLDDSGDVFRFHLDRSQRQGERDNAVLKHIDEAVAAGEDVELECARQLPEAFGGAGDTSAEADRGGLLDIAAEQGNEVGLVQAVDADAGTIDLRIAARDRPLEGVGPSVRRMLPHPSGILHLAVMGDKRRLQRRAVALKRVLNGKIPLPQLLPLLQGQLARGRERHKPIKPQSDAAWACFKGEPTPVQQQALASALNTPDIAVIQGPPGTGKTQLIAALQVRLAEEGKRHAVVSRSMLLTSFQHAAVDNLVERSKVWDIPAIKVDSRNRGSTAHISVWLADTIEALRRELSSTEDGRRALALRDVARQAAAYHRAPLPAEELQPILERIVEQTRGLVPDELTAKLDQLRMDLSLETRIAVAQADPRRESALRAVRGIRHNPVSFADDGPDMAAAALVHLARLEEVDNRHCDVLRQAADWMGADVPPFIAELASVRDALLDQLQPSPRLVRPAARGDVMDLLDSIIDELDASRSASEEGIGQALTEYLEDLSGDPLAVQHTLRLYTTSLATTCQQADSWGIKEAKDGEVLFDTVIVDEAARANPLDLLIPLTKATRRIVLVGDQNQLPHMLEPDVERELEAQQQVDELALLRKSVFAQLFTLLKSDPALPERAMRLNAQFRMHPVLGRFVSRNFYDGGLQSPRPAADFQHGIDGYHGKPAAWIRVPNSAGQEFSGKSKSRPVEARRIAEELRRVALARPDLTFGVISFYTAQVQQLWNELFKVGLAVRSGRGYRPVEALLRDDRGREVRRLQVGTVDAFQGKEFDVSYLSVTRSARPPVDVRQARDPRHPRHGEYARWVRRTYGHLVLRSRLCVAMSRQQRLLAVVGDDALFQPDLAPPEVGALTDFLNMCRGGVDGVLP
jgi:hypothetical protein